MQKSSKKRGSFLVTAIVICAITVLMLCLSQLVPKFLEYRKSDATFGEIRDSAITAYDPAEVLEAIPVGDRVSDTSGETTTLETPSDVKDALQIDWDAFSGTEIVAWFQMDKISYPIMQHSDNNYYLHRLPDGRYNFGGSLFLLNHNNPLFTDQSSFVYGHNMNNGSMFGTLSHYAKDDYIDHQFYIYLPDGTRHTYKFFCVATVFQESKAYTWSFESDQTFLDWQEWLLKESRVNTGMQPTQTGRFVTLSTCNGASGSNHRFIVVGIEDRVDQLQQPASWYGEYISKYNERIAGRTARANEIRDRLEALQKKSRDVLRSEYVGLAVAPR